jgi:hypothetical protein
MKIPKKRMARPSGEARETLWETGEAKPWGMKKARLLAMPKEKVWEMVWPMAWVSAMGMGWASAWESEWELALVWASE